MDNIGKIDVKAIESSVSAANVVKSFDDEHKAFAASRVDQFVYVPTKDSFFSSLDQHADTLECDVKPPLVLVGNEGSGKSALLANWVSKRLEHKHREEFLFQHFLSHTLLRLETALNDFFQLHDMTVPDSEEDLRWSLNRFLAAAAKKHSPARIVVVIDGVHRLKNETGPDGALHWLPTELPSCVRFIVSTVEFDRARGNDSLQHRTFIELSRRNCPILRIEPLGVPTRHSIIDAFMERNDGIELTENQQFKIVTAQATSQPMYLRSLLHSLRLSRKITGHTIDYLLDMLLFTGTAHELIHESLNIYCKAIFPESSANGANRRFEALGKILSMVYVSRNGLSFEEIWGVLSLTSTNNQNALTSQLDEESIKKLLLVLQDFTMVVNNMYSFTHEIYREVVFSTYIASKDSLIRWHNVLAKYFGQFPSCTRKLVALPYHLEEAGSWARVKNCLTDIEMFRLWWKQQSKSDLIKYWASLTRGQVGVNTTLGASNSNGNMNQNQSIMNKKRTGISSSIMANEFGTSSEVVHGQTLTQSSALASGNLNVVPGSPQHPSNGLMGISNTVVSNSLNKRPTYDIVDEYVRSLEEYRALKQPSDEVVADIVLEIADFLLEFAICGHEMGADVPSNVHPMIPTEDLEAMGVPYIENDRDSRSSLHYPAIFLQLKRKLNTEDGTGNDAPSKTLNEIPEYTTYFFTRWLWIQFPYIALGNANLRYEQGLLLKNLTDANERDTKNSATGKGESMRPTTSSSARNQKGNTATSQTRLDKSLDSLPKTWPGPHSANGEGALLSQSMERLRLPEIPKFHRKVARSVRKVPNADASDPMDEITQKLMFLQDDIQAYREECDFLGQLRSTLEHKLFEIKGQLIDLQRTEEATHNYDDALNDIVKREKESAKKVESVKVLNKNLKNIVMMCDRHPASFPSAIEDLKQKVLSDNYLLQEIKQRLWEQKFERQTHEAYFKDIRRLVSEGTEMHKSLLQYRVTARKHIAHQAIEDEKRMKATENSIAQETGKMSANPLRKTSLLSGVGSANGTKGNTRTNHGKNGDGKGSVGFVLSKNQPKNWEDTWAIISARTCITDPDIFFHRINNGKLLEDQMNLLKKQSESRLDTLKRDVVNIEAELEETRYAASVVGGQSIKEQQKTLMDKQFVARHSKERAEAAEQLQQRVLAGLVHLGEMLGIQPRDDEGSITDLQRDIEAVLDTLLDEREKQVQQQGQPHGNSGSSQSSMDTYSRNSLNGTNIGNQPNPETHHRTPELDFILSKFETPTVRLPDRIPSKSVESKYSVRGEEDDDSNTADEGTWDRAYVKTQSLKNVRLELKKAARHHKPN